MLRIPIFKEAVDAVVARLRRPPSFEPILVAERDLNEVPEVHRMLENHYLLDTQGRGLDHETAMINFHALCTHVECAGNYELGGRKAFWVDTRLAELLRETTLDIGGDVLRLPFPACAFLFDDDVTLATVERLIEESRGRSGPRRRMLTVYAFPIRPELSETGIQLVFLADAFDGDWPFLIGRDIPTDGKRNLDEILSSHPHESDDVFFRSPDLRALVHLVINAVLYTTCRELMFEIRRPPQPGGGISRQQIYDLCGETVFYLPGRIVIDHAKQPSGMSAPTGPARIIRKRFWVRGHWRRPNATWKDQRLRWIAPYLKGPEMTAIIERQYDLKSSAEPVEDQR